MHPLPSFPFLGLLGPCDPAPSIRFRSSLNSLTDHDVFIVTPPPAKGLAALFLWLFVSLSYASPVPSLRPVPTQADSLSAHVYAQPVPAVNSDPRRNPTEPALGAGSANYHPSSDLALPDYFLLMKRKAKATITVLSSLIAYVSVNSLARTVNPQAFVWSHEDKDEDYWISTSPSWFDRKACRWLGICGAAHFQPARDRLGHRLPGPPPEESLLQSWFSEQNNSVNWDDVEWSRRVIPDYVFEYAPLVHLFSNEQFWPCDPADHLFHTTPMLNYTQIESRSANETLRNLDGLNQWNEGWNVFLTSDDDVEDRPRWMEGEKNIPQSEGNDAEPWADGDGQIDGQVPGDTPEERAEWFDAGDAVVEDDYRIKEELRRRYGGEPMAGPVTGGRSHAPAVLLVMDKGNGIVDAFWFYFYSFNLGNVVFNVRFGNHVGDWEHCLVRFYHGKPKALFFSAHSAGQAYSYEAMEKIGHRPVIYSAEGTHAMYPTPGIHSYILPWGLLHDETDRGPLWDPLLNSHAYTYDYANDTLRASTSNPSAPTAWFYFNGHWGDKFYPLADGRQYRFAGQYHYVNGPLGPRFKHLNRRKVCQGPDDRPCVVKDWIVDSKRPKRWTGVGPE